MEVGSSSCFYTPVRNDKEKQTIKTHVKGITFSSVRRYRGGRRQEYPVFKVSIDGFKVINISIPKHGWDNAWKKAVITHCKLRRGKLCRRDWRPPSKDLYINTYII